MKKNIKYNGWYKVADKKPDTTGNYLCISNDEKIMVCYMAKNGWWSIVPGAQYYGDMGKKVTVDSKIVDREVIWWKPIGDMPE